MGSNVQNRMTEALTNPKSHRLWTIGYGFQLTLDFESAVSEFLPEQFLRIQVKFTLLKFMPERYREEEKVQALS